MPIGHDPQFLLTRKTAGKTVTETFPNPTALRKAQREIAEFCRFQQLSEDLVCVNQKICELRPVEQQRGGWTEQKKTAAAIPQENAAGGEPPAGATANSRPAARSMRSSSPRHSASFPITKLS